MSFVWFVIRDLLTGGLMGRVETDELIDMFFFGVGLVWVHGTVY